MPGFLILDRRDRSDRPNRGGIIIYTRQDLNNLNAFRKTVNAERIWGLVQRDSECVAICNWYLPPGNSIEEIDSLRQELEEISDVADSVIICGDLNVHHTSWLEYSNGDTPRGRSLKDVCDSFFLSTQAHAHSYLASFTLPGG